MRTAADWFAEGELHRRLPPFRSQELALLADSMNRSAVHLDQHIHGILNQQNEHEAMLSSMEEGVLAVDNHGAILSLNETCAASCWADAANCRRIIYEVIRKPDLLSFVEAALGTQRLPQTATSAFTGRRSSGSTPTARCCATRTGGRSAP